MTTVLLLTALLFPTWTSHIKGSNSVNALEQVKINGSNHEVMIGKQFYGRELRPKSNNMGLISFQLGTSDESLLCSTMTRNQFP